MCSTAAYSNQCREQRKAHKVLAIEGPKGYILPLLDVTSRAVVHEHVAKDVSRSLLHFYRTPHLSATPQHTSLHKCNLSGHAVYIQCLHLNVLATWRVQHACASFLSCLHAFARIRTQSTRECTWSYAAGHKYVSNTLREACQL